MQKKLLTQSSPPSVKPVKISMLRPFQLSSHSTHNSYNNIPALNFYFWALVQLSSKLNAKKKYLKLFHLLIYFYISCILKLIFILHFEARNSLECFCFFSLKTLMTCRIWMFALLVCKKIVSYTCAHIRKYIKYT